MNFDQLEHAINTMSDKDWSWWPFLWLRPEPHARFSMRRLAAVSVLYGLPVGLLSALLIYRFAPEAHAAIPMVVAAFPLLFLFVGSVVVAPMWNRRAVRLRPTTSRR